MKAGRLLRQHRRRAGNYALGRTSINNGKNGGGAESIKPLLCQDGLMALQARVIIAGVFIMPKYRGYQGYACG